MQHSGLYLYKIYVGVSQLQCSQVSNGIASKKRVGTQIEFLTLSTIHCNVSDYRYISKLL